MDAERLKETLQLDHALDVRLFEIGGTSITVATLVIFVAIVLATMLASRLTQRAITKGFKARKVTDEGTIGVTTRLTHYLILTVGLGVGLHTLGINLTGLFAAGAVLAVGIGFAMQTIAQNFVSGVILLIERSITPGDVIEIDGQLVRVSRMSIRTTHARTLDDEEVIVPNSHLVQSMVTNYTLRDTLYRISSEVGVIYGSDMKQVRETLERAAAAIDWRTRDRDPVVLLVGFGDSAVNFRVSVWIDDPWTMMRKKSALNETVWWALKEAEITIAFPQLDLHLDPPALEALRKTA